jgi:hypothetical protein
VLNVKKRSECRSSSVHDSEAEGAAGSSRMAVRLIATYLFDVLEAHPSD